MAAISRRSADPAGRMLRVIVSRSSGFSAVDGF